MQKKLACGCGFLVALLFLVAGFIFWRLSMPPQQIASSVPTSPEQRAQQQAAVQQLRSQIETIHQQARKNERAPFTLHITETQLNGLLAKGVEKGSDFDVQNLAVKLDPNLLTLQGTANYHGAPVSLTLTGDLTLEDSKIQFNANSLWLGPFSAPSKWRKKAAKFVTKQINQVVSKDASHLDTVEIKSGEIVVTGVTQ
jgi:hypothetical protein